ncbi:MAG: SIR2 family protein [Anaerolineales bacterium]
MGRIFILGAGFSKPAGYPLGPELITLLLAEAKRRTLYQNIIEPDIESYLYYLEAAKAKKISEQQIDFEDFISFLDYEHFLGLRGSDTWSIEGNRGQIAIRNLIAYVLHKVQPSPASLPLYHRFAQNLRPDDFIFTFNYDNLLEGILHQEGIHYRLFPDRFTSIQAYSATPDMETEEVVLLKVHGSIDWFDISTFAHHEDDARRHPLYTRPRHVVFEDPGILLPEKIVSSLYWPDSPLQNIYRIKDLDSYFRSATFVMEAPLIVAPSFSKVIHLNPLKEFWDGFRKVGAYNSGVAVIGFSMPSHDDYVLQPIFHLITNFQRVKDLPTGLTKSRLKMVDLRQDVHSIAEYKSRYPFVEWEETDTYFDGFDQNAVDLLFE